MTLIEAIERARADAKRIVTHFVIYRWWNGYGYRWFDGKDAVVGFACVARYTVGPTGRVSKIGVTESEHFTVEQRNLWQSWVQVHGDDGHAVRFHTSAAAQSYIDRVLCEAFEFRVAPYDPTHNCLLCGELVPLGVVSADATDDEMCEAIDSALIDLAQRGAR